MYKVSLTNFDIHYSETFNTFEEAVAFAKGKGFEATILDATKIEVAGSWSPIGGTRRYNPLPIVELNEGSKELLARALRGNP